MDRDINRLKVVFLTCSQTYENDEDPIQTDVGGGA
jgi:hypothetical protein